METRICFHKSAEWIILKVYLSVSMFAIKDLNKNE